VCMLTHAYAYSKYAYAYSWDVHTYSRPETLIRFPYVVYP